MPQDSLARLALGMPASIDLPGDRAYQGPSSSDFERGRQDHPPWQGSHCARARRQCAHRRVRERQRGNRTPRCDWRPGGRSDPERERLQHRGRHRRQGRGQRVAVGITNGDIDRAARRACRPASRSWRARPRSCVTAMRCARSRRSNRAGKPRDETEHFRVVDPVADAGDRDVPGVGDSRYGQLHVAADHAISRTSTFQSSRCRSPNRAPRRASSRPRSRARSRTPSPA